MIFDPAKSGFLTRYRTLILILSVFLFLPPLAFIFQLAGGDANFCGTWCPRMFYVIHKGAGINGVIGVIARSFMGVALVVGILFSTFFIGRFWCSHLCPVGGIGELGSRMLPKFFKIDYSSIPAAPVRYGYLAVYLAAPLLGLGSLCCNYCNFASVPRLFGAAFVQADLMYFFRAYGLINLALLILLGFMARGGRAYCNFLCPIGALDALSSLLGKRFGKRMRIVTERCDSCGKCCAVCPVWAIRTDAPATIDTLSCITCGECAKFCPEEAIRYGKDI